MNCIQIKRARDMPHTVLTCNLKESIGIIVCHNVQHFIQYHCSFSAYSDWFKVVIALQVLIEWLTNAQLTDALLKCF